jgi:8-oxo-dGTP diphosphatase
MKEVAVGILRARGNVLACQRKRDAVYPLKWEFPGGKIEHGESSSIALHRELREELGIEAVIGREFHRQEWVYPGSATASGDGAFRVYYHEVESFKGMPVNLAFEQIRWVGVNELLMLDMLDGNREAIEMLLSNARPRPHP